MRIITTLLLTGSLAQAAPAVAAEASATGGTPAEVREAFGNTIVSTYPDGRTAEIWLSSDGTYTGEGRRHDRSSGTWKIKSERICFDQKHPWIPIFHTFCAPLPAGHIGDSWAGHAPTGERTRVRLVSGHVTGEELVGGG